MRQERKAGSSQPGPGTGRAALGAAAVMLTLTIWGRGLALALAGVLVGPVPALRTALTLGRAAGGDSGQAVPTEEDAAAADESGASSAIRAALTDVERYLVPLLGEDQRPADAGAVVETAYGQGSGENYIPCAAGTIKNNTSVSSAEVAAEIQNPLPFNVELNSAEPQVLVMHTHATECYRMSEGLWFVPGDGARTTDRASNMCAVGQSSPTPSTPPGSTPSTTRP